MNFSVVILAAGNSQRMGTHKALLRWDDNDCFLGKIIKSFQELKPSKVVVVTNKSILESEEVKPIRLMQDVQFVENNYPEKKRLYSLSLGLKSINSANPCFMHNVDNPFVDTEILRSLLEYYDEEKTIVPEFNDQGGHPVLIGAKIVQRILSNESKHQRLDEIFKSFGTKRLKYNSMDCLININSPEDYKKYFG